jgi:glycogen(starch) synthase
MPLSDTPRRVLMTADAVGGVWTYALELCRELNTRGVEITLAVMGPSPSPEQHEEIGTLQGVTLHAHPYRLEWMAEPWDDVAAAGAWLTELESRVAPDVVHLNGYCHGACPFHAPTLIVGHSCVLSWWRAVFGQAAPPEWDRYARDVRQGLHSVSAIVAPSHGMLASLHELYGPLRNARVIANGRSPALALDGKEPLILTSGRLWDEAKNVASVCDVASELPWRVAVAGPLAGVNIDEISSSVCTDRVRYLGRLPGPAVREWMARASIYALPARYEPFGLSVLEAAQARCALVLGDIPTLREIWGDAAIYVPPGDKAALRRALASLIEDHRGREAMATAAWRRAASMTPRRMADQYYETYSELIRERRPVLSLGAV